MDAAEETVGRQGGLGRGLAALLPTARSEPTEPIGPTAAIPSTGPTEATEPTGGAEPDEPTEPSHLSGGAERDELTGATQPTGPTETTSGAEPDEPTGATQPTEPTEPTGATSGAEPDEPTGATQPTEPTGPTGPTGEPRRIGAPGERGPETVTDFGTELVAELATNQSGLALIYRALDMLVERFELSDAAIVIEEPGVGRQVFRAGRRPLADNGAESELLTAPPGIYTDPELEDGRFDASLLTSLCVVALRLDLLRYDSWHDPLTGLFDRRSFDRLLEMSVARSVRYRWPFTLVVLDLDTLKELNDCGGHAAGDAALASLGERLRRVLRFGDNAARIGGDEFALILPNTDPDDVPALLERLAEVPGVDEPCPSFSFGVALSPGETDDAERLFRLADERLYEAKEGRR